MSRIARIYSCLECGSQITDADKTATNRTHGIDVCKECSAPPAKKEKKRQRQAQFSDSVQRVDDEDKYLALETCDELLEIEDAAFAHVPRLSVEERSRRDDLLLEKEIRQIELVLEL